MATLSQPGLPPLQSERSGGREIPGTAGVLPATAGVLPATAGASCSNRKILSRKVHALSQPGLPPLRSERSGGREIRLLQGCSLLLQGLPAVTGGF